MAGVINHRVRLMLSASWIVVFSLAFGVGCQDRPARVSAPSWDPEEISRRALDRLDMNGDSAIDAEEVNQAPGLAAAFARIDTNRDSQLSQAEIRTRIELYERLGTGLISQSFQILMNGRPLSYGRVEFVPEEFLRGVIEIASGDVDGSGMVIPQTVGQSIPAMQLGFYRVVPYGSEDTDPLPTRNSLGVEVSPLGNDRESGTPVLKFEAKK